jgi:hypothetical protein
MALSALWWTPVIFQARNVLPFVLFIGVPGISAAVAGSLFGKPLLISARTRSARVAALRGVAIASFALLLFAPLFATIYVLTAPANEHWNVVGLTLVLLIGSTVAVWWIAAMIGAAVGWMLFRFVANGK